MKYAIPLLLLFLTNCSAINSSPRLSPDTELQAIETLLNTLHAAASQADGKTYFGAFHPEAIFIGTCQSERWNMEQFKAYVAPHFAKGQGWTYITRDRHIMIAPNGIAAWFDEALFNKSLGDTRGSGTLIKVGGAWKLTHYVLSFPIPNDAIDKILPIIKDHQPATKMPRPTSPSDTEFRL